ncbi:helix-turn-helix domain-containing protein [Schaedlerella arabinosiphila]|uniref:helix-turn-helix domain-containing protein n=1 Tax=Schaedlerella arabinosiphila TaxID=2044587 RepID=UPI002557CC44|nr:helix-turn-helix domain-containing protein [Schaedlerella arabinosiphila]
MNERIKKLRKTLDLTQQKFADKLCVKRNTVGQWEIGRNELTDAAILSICREFNVNEEWLRTGEGEMFEKLTEQQEILKYTGLLLKDKDSTIANAIQSLIVTYEQLDDSSKTALENIAQQYLENLKKGQ